MSALAAFPTEGYLCEGDRVILQWAAIETQNVTGDIVEIGTANGLSTTVILSACHQDKSLLCIDPVTSMSTLAPAIETVGGVDARHVSLECNRIEDPCVWDSIPKEISMAFVDHSHQYDATVIALSVLWERLNSGGIIVVHDFRHEDYHGGTRACLEFVEKNRDISSIRFSSCCIAFKKA